MARPVARDIPHTSLVELRVHGVGGSSPEAVLAVDSAVRLTDELVPGIPGDESAGFFQPDQPGSRLSNPDRRLEAYSWGGLTSRSAARALWLILAPFAMSNLAGWMIEHDGEPTQPNRTPSRFDVLNRSLARLVALSLTVETFFLASRVALDQFALQCGSQGVWCGRWWLRALSFTDGMLGRNLVVGMAFPLGVLALVGIITRRSQTFLHGDWIASRSGGMTDPAFARNLTHPEFWAEPEVGHRLGIAHVSAGFATIGLTLVDVLASRTGGDHRAFQALLLGALAVAAWLVVRLRSPVWLGWSLMTATIGLLAALMVQTWSREAAPAPLADTTSPTGSLDQWVFSSQIALIALLVVATLSARLSRPRSVDRDPYRWLLPPFLMVAAAGLISAFGNGFTIAVAALLGEAGPRGGSGMSAAQLDTIFYGQSAGLVASVFVLALLAMAIATLAMFVRDGRHVPVARVIAAEYDPPLTGPLAARVRRARAVATIPDRAPEILGAGVFTLVSILAVLLVRSGGRLESPVFSDTFRFMHGISSGILLALPVVGALLIFQAYRAPGWRRIVGIIWDVTTFWPRWFHPFAPPSYGERAIPDLERRLSQITGAGERVVVSAHSQGSLLAAAALAVGPNSGVGLVTHGSPLQRLYARFFPEYAGGAFSTRLHDRLEGRWVNLYRLTDYIGGPIPDCGDDRLIADPFTPSESESIGTHLGYDRQEPHALALRELAERF